MRKRLEEILLEIRPESDFADSQDFIGDGLLDSFDMVVLVSTLDAEFHMSIAGIDIVPENFASLDSIISLVLTSRAAR